MMMTMMGAVAFKGAAILAGAAIASALVGRASASLRHLVWTAALVALLALPALEATGVRIEVPVPSAWLPSATPRPVDAREVPPPAIERARAGTFLASGGDHLGDAVTDAPPVRAAWAVGRSVAVDPRGVAGGTGSENARVSRGSGSGGAGGVAGGSASGGERGIASGSGSGRARSVPVTAVARERVGASPAPPGLSGVGLTASRPAAAPRWSPIPWQPLVASVWTLGTLLLLTTAVLSHLVARRLTRRGVRPAPRMTTRRLDRLASEMGVRTTVRLVVSGGIRVPATWGLVGSTIVLPEHFASWSTDTLDRVLLHELAHVGRRDCMTRLLGELARALHWPNPLAWWAVARQRLESERACDDRVLAHGDVPSAYAEDLIGLVRALKAEAAPPRAVLAMAGSSGLGSRVRAILDPRRSRREVGRPGAIVAMVAAVGLSVALAGFVPVASAQERPGEAVAPLAPVAPAKPVVPSGPVTPSEPLAAPELTAPEPVGPSEPMQRLGAVAAAFGVSVSVDPPLPSFLPERVVRWSAALVPQRLVRGSAPDQSQELCVFRDGGSHSSSSHTDDDVRRIRWESDGCRIEIDLEGDVEFEEDDSGVARMADGALFEVEERMGRSSRRIRFEGRRGGAIERRYWVDGDDVAWGPEAERWVAQILPELFRHTTINAQARVRRLLDAGGTETVFREVDRMRSDHVASTYLEILMVEADLAEAEYRRVIDFAGGFDSDHNSAELLLAVVDRAGLRPAFQTPMLRAAEGLESDHQKTRILQALLESPLSSEQLDAVVRSARSIESDHNLAMVLSTVAAEGRLSDAGRASFMETLATLESDHQHAMVLMAFLDSGRLTDDELGQVLAMTEGLESDHQRATVLQRVAADYSLTGPQVTAYLLAASDIESDHQVAVTAEAIIERADFDTEQLALVLDLADRVSSDHQRAMILGSVIRRRELNGTEVAGVLLVAQGITSDHQLSSTLSLLATDEELDDASVLGVVEAAGQIESDHSRASVLVTIAGRYRVEGPARELYRDLADEMGSHQRSQALAALVR